MHPQRSLTKGCIRAYRKYLRFLQLQQWHQLQPRLLHLFPLLRRCLHQSPRTCLHPYPPECRRLCRRLTTIRPRDPAFRCRLRCREDSTREGANSQAFPIFSGLYSNLLRCSQWQMTHLIFHRLHKQKQSCQIAGNKDMVAVPPRCINISEACGPHHLSLLSILLVASDRLPSPQPLFQIATSPPDYCSHVRLPIRTSRALGCSVA